MYVKSEFQAAKKILMHTPGEEVYFGTLHAEGCLFEAPFDRMIAANEHKSYIDELRSRNIEVNVVSEVLLEGVIDNAGQIVLGTEYDQLIKFALDSLTYKSFTINKSDLNNYKRDSIEKMSPYDLVRIILQRPVIEVDGKSRGMKTVSNISVMPLMNLYFTRDQQIITDKGLVMGKMGRGVRQIEVEVMKYVFSKIGIVPIYQVTGSGVLEGGDYIPVGDFALIGQGDRTNPDGIKQLLDNGVFGFDEIAVVKDPDPGQEQMHLDTYFNIVGDKLALVETSRVNSPKRMPLVDVYSLQAGRYVLSRSDVDFTDYIENEKQFNLIELDKNEQLRYGINVLCISDRNIITSNDVSGNYEGKLIRRNINFTALDFSNIRLGYGSNHCMTQVYSRI